MPKKILIATSTLGIDYGRLNEHMKELEPVADWFHVDIMDGNFVPNLSIGPMVVERMETEKPLDCHLMALRPHLYLEALAKAGAYSITIHAEASLHLSNDVDKIRALGCRAAVSISPGTPIEKIAKVLPKLDMVLVMSVEPGFGGQKFMPEVLEKVRWLRAHYPNLDIQVDGGINDETAPLAVEAGANVLVVGSYLVKAADPGEALKRLKRAAGL